MLCLTVTKHVRYVLQEKLVQKAQVLELDQEIALDASLVTIVNRFRVRVHFMHDSILALKARIYLI